MGDNIISLKRKQQPAYIVGYKFGRLSGLGTKHNPYKRMSEAHKNWTLGNIDGRRVRENHLRRLNRHIESTFDPVMWD